MAGIPMHPPARIVSVMVLLFVAHMLQIGIYALFYAAAEHWWALGTYSGVALADPLDYFYFSATTYTSLGIGDIAPVGHVRFLAGVEALNGLLLIAWSASFLYALMNRLWVWQPCVTPGGPPRDISAKPVPSDPRDGPAGADDERA